MSKLQVTYADGSEAVVGSDLTPEQYFDSLFGGYDAEVKERCKVVALKEPDAEPVAKPSVKPAAKK